MNGTVPLPTTLENICFSYLHPYEIYDYKRRLKGLELSLGYFPSLHCFDGGAIGSITYTLRQEFAQKYPHLVHLKPQLSEQDVFYRVPRITPITIGGKWDIFRRMSLILNTTVYVITKYNRHLKIVNGAILTVTEQKYTMELTELTLPFLEYMQIENLDECSIYFCKEKKCFEDHKLCCIKHDKLYSTLLSSWLSTSLMKQLPFQTQLKRRRSNETTLPI